jgi:DNA mismatch endonuclease (patch repair protein)
MRSQRQRDTKLELEIRRALHAIGFRFRVDYRLFEGLRRRADIAFPGRRVAVFVDGCFWHGCPEHATWPKENADWWRAKLEANQLRDQDTDSRLRKAGWTVIRVWEHEGIDSAVERISTALRQAHLGDRTSSFS